MSSRGGAPVPESRRAFARWWADEVGERLDVTVAEAFAAGFDAAMQHATPLDQLLYEAGKAKSQGKTVELRIQEVGRAGTNQFRLDLRIGESH